MSDAKVKLLIVEDDASLRMSLSQLFSTIGHRVRSAEDGRSALVEIQNEVPDILLSDLNMPGMSGFELLFVVRSRFPMVKVIAMSGSFSGDCVPPGVAADAFYEKGSNLRSLLRRMEVMSQSKMPLPLPPPGQAWNLPEDGVGLPLKMRIKDSQKNPGLSLV